MTSAVFDSAAPITTHTPAVSSRLTVGDAEAQQESEEPRDNEEEAVADEEAAREAEWHRRELEREERIRARLRHRAATERGLRRLRPGPGRAVGGSPVISSMAPPPEALDHEISAIERVLNERGPLPSQEIQRLVGARYWGPGVFSLAMAAAVAGGLVKRAGRNTYAPAGENG